MADNEKENNVTFSDKVGFIVGFCALILALNPFDSMKEAGIDLLIWKTNFSVLIQIFLGLLATSIYSYAINYIRFDFPSLLEWKSLRHVETFGNILYAFTLFFYPFLILLLALASLVIRKLSSLPSGSHEIVFIILTITSSLSFFVTAVRNAKLKSQLLNEELRAKEHIYFEEAKQTYNSPPSELKLLRLYKFVTSILEGKLQNEYGVAVKRIPPSRLFLLGKIKGILDEHDLNVLQRLRTARNAVAHSQDDAFSSRLTASLINDCYTLIQKLHQQDRKVAIKQN